MNANIEWKMQESRLLVYCLQHYTLPEIWVMMTQERHGTPALSQALRELNGPEWFMDLFLFAKREIRETVIEDDGDESLKLLFQKKMMGKPIIKKKVLDFIQRASELFGEPTPIEEL